VPYVVADPYRTPAERFAIILAGLRQVVAAQSISKRMADELIRLLWDRLGRLGQRFAKVVAQLEAGTLRPPAPPRERPAGARPERPSPALRLPNGFAWLVRIAGWEAAGRGSQLQYLLRDPEMAALIAAAPQLVRLLRPLCRMLGIDTAGLLPPPVKRRRASEQAQASAPQAATRAKTPQAETPRPNARLAERPERSPEAVRKRRRREWVSPTPRFSKA
jgi:hypothetical protein